MTDPEVVNAIESNFVPVLIINNKPGKDAKWLKKFNEPAWNYQVIRFLNHQEKDIIPRKDRIWTKKPLLERIQKALKVYQRK